MKKPSNIGWAVLPELAGSRGWRIFAQVLNFLRNKIINLTKKKIKNESEIYIRFFT